MSAKSCKSVAATDLDTENDLKQDLANPLVVAVASENSIYSNAMESEAIICICKKLEKLVEAVSL